MRHTGLGNTLVAFFPVAFAIIGIVVYLILKL
jgi:hypothetical protein